jgi:phage I-like protein
MTDDELRALFKATAEESRRGFEAVAELLEKKFDRLAEATALLDEKVERRTNKLDSDMQSGFAETQAMIKFSHTELDRRVRTLEANVADLSARVERLEESAH